MGGVGSFSQLKLPAVFEFTGMAGCFARTLTTGIDSGALFTGGSADDTFNATQLTLNATDVLVGGTGTDTLSLLDTGTSAFTLPGALVSGVEKINVRNINGTPAVAAVTGVTAVNETQAVTLSGTPSAATALFFLGISTTVTGSDTLANDAAAIAANKANILAGPTAQAYGVTDISASGAVLTLTFGGANGKGDVAPIAASATSAAVSFSAGVQATQGVLGVVALPAVAAAGYTDTVTATNFVGATEFNSDNSTSAVSISGLTASQAAGVIGNASTLNGAFSPSWGSTVATATVNVSGGTKLNTNALSAITLAGSALTSATVNSTAAPLTSTGLIGTNVIGNLTLAATQTALTINATSGLTLGSSSSAGALTNTTAAALKTITVTGEGAVNLGSTALESAVETINAGTNSGGLTVALGSNVAQTVTGSTGNDVITTGAVLTTGSVNVGAGTDTLVITAGGTHVANATLGAKYVGFDTLRLSDSQDVSFIAGITALELSAATSKTYSKITATQAAAIKVLGSQATDVTLTLDNATGSSDVVSLNLASATSTSNVSVAALSIVGVETLNLAATTGTSGSDDTITFASGGADKLTTLNITGANDVNLSGTNITKAVAVNDNGTGKLTLSGNFAAGSVINGSATKVNAFTVGTNEGVTYKGGAAADTFTFGQALLLADGTTDTTIIGGAGNDTLTLSDATAALTDTYFTNVSGFENLTLTGTTAISLTAGGSFKTAFADGVTITSGTVGAATGGVTTYALGLYDKPVNLTLVTAEDGVTVADNISVVTGSAADTVTVTAASWVGHGSTDGSLVINTGAGNDTISLTTGTIAGGTNANLVQVIGGVGADSITVSHVNAATGTTGNIIFTTAALASPTTGYDQITGYKMSDIAGAGAKIADGLDFDSVALTAYSATTASGYSSAELTVAVSSTGVVTFAGTSASSLSVASKIAAVQSVVTTNSGDSAFFVDNGNTYVFNNNATSDSIIQLVGVSGSALITTNDATTDNGIYIL
jgi:hypothetical protein